MTVIAPFDPKLQAGAVPYPASLAPPPANAFAALLDNRAPDEEIVRSATFGFGQLGMFGLHAVQAATEPVASVAQSARTSSLASSTTTKDADAAHAMIQPLVVAQASPMMFANELQVEARAPQSRPLMLIPLADASGATLGVVMEQAPSASNVSANEFGALSLKGSAPAMPPLPTPKPPSTPVNLVVSGADDALTVVARAQSESLDGAIKLRHLVEATVAEFEMKISKFQLNGMPTELAFSLGGGLYGGKSR